MSAAAFVRRAGCPQSDTDSRLPKKRFQPSSLGTGTHPILATGVTSAVGSTHVGPGLQLSLLPWSVAVVPVAGARALVLSASMGTFLVQLCWRRDYVFIEERKNPVLSHSLVPSIDLPNTVGSAPLVEHSQCNRKRVVPTGLLAIRKR